MRMTLVAHVEIVHIPKNNLAPSIEPRWPNLELIVQQGILCKEKGKSIKLVTIICTMDVHFSALSLLATCFLLIFPSNYRHYIIQLHLEVDGWWSSKTIFASRLNRFPQIITMTMSDNNN